MTSTAVPPPIRVLHPITRLIVGGAQESTLLTASALIHDASYAGRYEVEVASGPQTGAEGSLIEELRGHGVPLHVVAPLVRQVSPADDLRAFLALRALMRDPRGGPRYDVVHTHSSKAGVLGRLAARAAGVPVIVHTVHGWSFHDRLARSRRALWVSLEKLGARCGDALVAVCASDVEKGLAAGIGRRESYSLIRSGIELERFGHPRVGRAALRAQLGIPADAPVVGSVTRLSEQKAPLDLADAFARIRESHPAARLVIVGDGPLRGRVEERLRELGSAGHALLTGLRRDVPELMGIFDVFVLTSLWEGLPRVLPQAMASGLPIVCTGADGSGEAVRDGENGFLVPRGDPAALAAAVARLLGDAPLRRQMGMAGQRRAPEFGAARMVEQLDALYRRLLASKRPAERGAAAGSAG